LSEKWKWNTESGPILLIIYKRRKLTVQNESSNPFELVRRNCFVDYTENRRGYGKLKFI